MCQILRRRLEKPNGGGQGVAVLATLATVVCCASVRGGVHRAIMSHIGGTLASALSASRDEHRSSSGVARAELKSQLWVRLTRCTADRRPI